MTYFEKLLRVIFDPSLLLRAAWRKLPIGRFELRSRFDAFDTPAHAYGILQAVKQAKSLGINRISAIEFGVASGRTFVSMQEIIHQISQEKGIQIDLYGFDLGSGLPASDDY
ncbi:hypothetical protein HY224_01955, partial [Candidatus Uhrbacteria bacterium]|nr:hypothetical protein [Candidatus Uhrbacteria bacterium]